MYLHSLWVFKFSGTHFRPTTGQKSGREFFRNQKNSLSFLNTKGCFRETNRKTLWKRNEDERWELIHIVSKTHFFLVFFCRYVRTQILFQQHPLFASKCLSRFLRSFSEHLQSWQKALGPKPFKKYRKLNFFGRCE